MWILKKSGILGWVEVASRSRSAALLNTEKVKYSREGGGEDARYVKKCEFWKKKCKLKKNVN